MGKISNILYMIDLLNTGNIYTLKDLSEKIGVTERMIRYYKNEICRNGVAIESFKGPNGGYFMMDKIKNYISINKYDIQLLDNIKNYLEKSNFKYIEEYKNFLDKSQKMFSIYEEKSKYISNIKINSPGEIEKLIEEAIDKNEKIEFKYGENNYVTAFCELRNDIRHFEIKIFLRCIVYY